MEWTPSQLNRLRIERDKYSIGQAETTEIFYSFKDDQDLLIVFRKPSLNIIISSQSGPDIYVAAIYQPVLEAFSRAFSLTYSAASR